MSLETDQLQNVAKTVRQIMTEDQEEREIEEMIKKVSAASYLDETQKSAVLEIFGLSKREKRSKARSGEKKTQADADARQKARADKRPAKYTKGGVKIGYDS